MNFVSCWGGGTSVPLSESSGARRDLLAPRLVWRRALVSPNGNKRVMVRGAGPTVDDCVLLECQYEQVDVGILQEDSLFYLNLFVRKSCLDACFKLPYNSVDYWRIREDRG